MGEPELRSDETILVRTQGIYVKSIPFEGILTSRRIILVDRAKNLLPPKEIPLLTIKNAEPGENAIRDQIITLSVMAKTGETRQMVLTFSRQAGGNRIRERDEWMRLLKEQTTSTFEQAIRKVILGFEQPVKPAEPSAPPRIEVVGSPVPQPAKATRIADKKEPVAVHPIKKIIEIGPVTSAPAVPDTKESFLGTFCSRCGNRVPDGSVFCNRCGSPILPSVQVPTPAPVHTPEPTVRPVVLDTGAPVPSGERLSTPIPSDPLRAALLELEGKSAADRKPEPVPSAGPEPAPAPAAAPADIKKSKRGIFTGMFTQEKPEIKIPSAPVTEPLEARKPKRGIFTGMFAKKPPVPGPQPGVPVFPAPKERRSPQFNKRVLITAGIIAVIIIAAVISVIFVLPVIMKGGPVVPGGTITTAPTTASTPKGTLVIPEETTPPSIPPTGVWVRISYLGGWKGIYGMSLNPQTVINSGDRLYEIENANGTVTASFEKLDGSTRHTLSVEIYKNGGMLTKGSTSVPYGKVSISADSTTGLPAPVSTSTGTLAITVVTTASASPSPATSQACIQ